MNQQIAILVKFHPATNSRGSRFSLQLPRWDYRKKFFSYDHAFNDTLDNALAILERARVPVAAVLDLGDHYALAIEWANRPQVFKMMGLPES
jgi:crotonobetainyl-CoA:carnitine CoA-transferase CaiB-like acyl-CoA transferase